MIHEYSSYRGFLTNKARRILKKKLDILQYLCDKCQLCSVIRHALSPSLYPKRLFFLLHGVTHYIGGLLHKSPRNKAFLCSPFANRIFPLRSDFDLSGDRILLGRDHIMYKLVADRKFQERTDKNDRGNNG